MKVDQPLGDPSDAASQLLHRCWLAYLSDDLPTDAVIRAASRSGDDEAAREALFCASLDHTIWFHAPLSADRWHLYDFSCVHFVGGRGLAIGYVFAADGTARGDGRPGGARPRLRNRPTDRAIEPRVDVGPNARAHQVGGGHGHGTVGARDAPHADLPDTVADARSASGARARALREARRVHAEVGCDQFVVPRHEADGVPGRRDRGGDRRGDRGVRRRVRRHRCDRRPDDGQRSRGVRRRRGRRDAWSPAPELQRPQGGQAGRDHRPDRRRAASPATGCSSPRTPRPAARR